MFESLMGSYKNMDQVNKKNALLNEIKNTITILQNLCEEKGIVFREISSKEILDLDNGKESIDDYLEAMFVYIKYLQELLGTYLEKTV